MNNLEPIPPSNNQRSATEDAQSLAEAAQRAIRSIRKSIDSGTGSGEAEDRNESSVALGNRTSAHAHLSHLDGLVEELLELVALTSVH
jgi:hypothetical protein